MVNLQIAFQIVSFQRGMRECGYKVVDTKLGPYRNEYAVCLSSDGLTLNQPVYYAVRKKDLSPEKYLPEGNLFENVAQ